LLLDSITSVVERTNETRLGWVKQFVWSWICRVSTQNLN